MIPETVSRKELMSYVMDLFKKLLPEEKEEQFLIDRIYRIVKPKQIPAELPRDTLMRVHFYHIKEKIIYTIRKKGSLPEPYAAITAYSDIFPATAQRWKQFSLVTKILRDNNIVYRWGYPTKLLVWYQNHMSPLPDPEGAMKTLYNWGLCPSPYLELDGGLLPHMSQRNGPRCAKIALRKAAHTPCHQEN